MASRVTSTDVIISKTLTYLLRHGAEKEKIPMRKDGYVRMSDLLQHDQLKKFTQQDIIRHSENSVKKRFSLQYLKTSDTDTEVWIKANHGHSLKVELQMPELTVNDGVDEIVHGTFYSSWDLIKDQGLSRMNRQHIHFSTGLYRSTTTVSGMRPNCEIAIYVDVKKAINHGLKFYRSENNVILCPGDENGFLDTIYFKRIVDLKTTRGAVPVDVKLSKTMSYLLRHGAEKEGLSMTADGFVSVAELLKHRQMRSYTQQDVIRVVDNCPKKRYFTQRMKLDANGVEELCIRANQGHSLEVDVKMDEITLEEPIDSIVHGTYFSNWNSIKDQGLSKMNRQHIHFSTGLPQSSEVISGMRNSCQIAIYVDIKKAIKDGLKFYRSQNNVILCPGDERGYLKPIYFKRVVDLRKSKRLNIYVSYEVMLKNYRLIKNE